MKIHKYTKIAAFLDAMLPSIFDCPFPVYFITVFVMEMINIVEFKFRLKKIVMFIKAYFDHPRTPMSLNL